MLAYDIPGHGESDPPAGQDSFDDLAADLAELLDHMQIGRITFVGLSIGGMIALERPLGITALRTEVLATAKPEHT